MSVKGFWLFFLSLMNTLAYGQGFSVSPSRVTLKGQPGQTVSQVISFTNSAASDLTLVTSVKDFNRDSLGVKRYYPAGSLENRSVGRSYLIVIRCLEHFSAKNIPKAARGVRSDRHSLSGTVSFGKYS